MMEADDDRMVLRLSPNAMDMAIHMIGIGSALIARRKDLVGQNYDNMLRECTTLGTEKAQRALDEIYEAVSTIMNERNQSKEHMHDDHST